MPSSAGPPVSWPPGHAAPISVFRRAWDYLPSGLRRTVVRAMGSERLRLTVLNALGIRQKSGFIALSNGGPAAIDIALQHLSTKGPVGDYYEFGLYRGYTFWYAQQSADHFGLGRMRFFGFDSFAGLPDIQGKDKQAGIFIPGDYVCTRAELESELSRRGFDWTRATLTEGFFEESLSPERRRSLGAGPAALVMVDCDLYQSTVPVLAFVADLLQDGTVILFDDWYCFGDDSQCGEPRAFREFCHSHPEWRAEWLMDFPTYGKAFVIRQAASAAPD